MKGKYPSIPAEPGTYPNTIREEALAIKLNVSDLARVMGTAEITMYDICNGRRLPGFENERKFEILFNKPIHELYVDVYNNKNLSLKLNLELVPKE